MTTTLEARNSSRIQESIARKAQRKTRVMVVDDHELVRRGLAALVNAEQDLEACAAAATASEALQAVMHCSPEVVVLDVSLQHGQGLALIQKIKAFNPEIRIVALAMYDKPEYMRRIFSAGAAALVSKGDLATRLLQAIRRPSGRRPATRVEHSVRNTTVARARGFAKARARLDEIEREIVGLIGAGLPAQSIAVRLHLSVNAVESYRRQIRDKLNFPSATELVEFCVSWVKRNESLVS
jgi:DNA-binding NarL/FixJ family response regulator